MKKARIETKKTTACLALMLFAGIAPGWACTVCGQNQPKILRGITHGAGPQGQWDYMIIIIGVIIVAATLFFSLKFLIKPGEKEKGHIKNIVADGF